MILHEVVPSLWDFNSYFTIVSLKPKSVLLQDTTPQSALLLVLLSFLMIRFHFSPKTEVSAKIIAHSLMCASWSEVESGVTAQGAQINFAAPSAAAPASSESKVGGSYQSSEDCAFDMAVSNADPVDESTILVIEVAETASSSAVIFAGSSGYSMAPSDILLETVVCILFTREFTSVRVASLFSASVPVAVVELSPFTTALTSAFFTYPAAAVLWGSMSAVVALSEEFDAAP